MKVLLLLLSGFCITLTIVSCEKNSDYELTVPKHFPEIIFPEDNASTLARIELGRTLFFDPNLSIDSTVSCSSCHHPHLAFADSVSLSAGVNDGHPMRNSPSLINVAFLPYVNKDGGATKLDLQALIPIEDEHEMGISILSLSERLNQNEEYVSRFNIAYDRDPDPYSISRVFAAYVRSLIGGTAPYDLYLSGDSTALNSDALKGKDLFFSERLACGSCHSGVFLTDNSFQNNGYKLDYGEDTGRQLVTGKDGDIGKFRVASLRNIAITAPYMHDGGIETLSDVIDAYAGGQLDHANKSTFINGFELSLTEKADLLSFLESLTDDVENF